MATDKKIDAYLAELERALGSIPVGDRAEIVTEIKSHVLDAKEREPARSIPDILAALGDPTAVANRYLLERGIPPGRPSRTPTAKWLALGAVGIASVGCITLLLILWRFTPIVSVDEKNDRVTLLGGAIDIDGSKNKVSVSSLFELDEDTATPFNGSKKFAAGEIDEVHIRFNNGKFEVEPSKDGELHWKCKYRGDAPKAEKVAGQKTFALSFEKTPGAVCEVALPGKTKLHIDGANGHLDLERPQAALEATLGNGRINLELDQAHQYRVATATTNGHADSFASTDAPGAIPVKVTVVNGTISRD